ncbi:hypothetical protein LZ32DRAFT_303009 [Colletotrichum eremochloae]|nr:hypothetical protein LZ32DRAFT_303009 [Colletotrichum eremochloae]
MDGLASAQSAQSINLYPCHHALAHCTTLNHTFILPHLTFSLRPQPWRFVSLWWWWWWCVWCACVRAQLGPALSQRHGSVRILHNLSSATVSPTPPPQLFSLLALRLPSSLPAAAPLGRRSLHLLCTHQHPPMKVYRPLFYFSFFPLPLHPNRSIPQTASDSDRLADSDFD